MRNKWLAFLAVAMWLQAAPGALAQTAGNPVRLQWQVPPLLPPGARLAIVSGDPTQPGQCTIQLSMPDGYRIPPHYHPSYEHVEVLEGKLLAGMGDWIDPTKTRPLIVGDSGTAPPGMRHWSIAVGRTVLAVTFNGPYTITYLRAEDAPRPRSFPFGY